HAGLWAAKAPFVFVAPCDMPFLQPGLVQALLAEVDGGADVVIPLKENGRMEPLCAVYSKACLPHIQVQLADGDCKIIRFFDKIRVRTVPVARLRVADPDLLSFVNLNTPDELAQARALATSRRV
ncbi:MAG: molybdenum cofactor guanylyltransferase, partial [Proteobacteria bacterium]|nr:molybdenum cofactor guanylyltransferase [Pseudomonadota bacterium]